MSHQFDEKAHGLALRKCEAIIKASEPRLGFCNATWDEMLCWKPAEAGTVASQNCPRYVSNINIHGKATRECGEDGLWIPNPEYDNYTGWTNYTNCFGGNLMSASIEKDVSRIQLMTNIGYGVSLVTLIIAVLIMLVARRLHCKSNSLHINLFLAFIMRAAVSFTKDILFVKGLGLEKDIIRMEDGSIKFNPEGSHWECKLLVTVFLYTVGASLMWTFMEGMYLHMLVYKTLFTERTGVRMYVVFGWVSPILYLLPWILVRVLLYDELCWNIDERGFYWIVKGPVILTIVINFVFFINIVRVLCSRIKPHRHVKGNNQQIRKLAKFSLVLIPLFGVPYIGFSAYPHGLDSQADIVYLYCEMFYNSFQGLILAILFCFLNEEVHKEIRRWWCNNRRYDNGFTRSLTLTSYQKGSIMSHSSVATARATHGAGKLWGTRHDRNENPLQASRHGLVKKTHTVCDESKDMFKPMSEADQEYPLMT